MFKKNFEKEFFDKLAEKLEELFPKTNIDNPEVPSKGNRTTALVFNAYANIIFREMLERVIESTKKEMREKFISMLDFKEFLDVLSKSKNYTDALNGEIPLPVMLMEFIKETKKKIIDF